MSRFLLCAALLSCGTPLFGQMSSQRVDASSVPVQVVADMHSDAAPAGLSATLRSRIGRMFTGAVVGGWLGFFASQVHVSDWDEATSRSDRQDRSTWAAAGVVVGAIAGRVLMPGQAPPDMPTDLGRGRSLIDRGEIVRSGAQNAWDLLRSMRPEWLIPRGVNSWRETAQGSADLNSPTVIVPGDDHILVYLDNAKLGGTQYLQEVGLANVAKIEWVDAAAATFRWGAGHAHGVIHIQTQPLTEDRH